MLPKRRLSYDSSAMDRSPRRVAVGRHAQRHVRTQYPVDGRGGGQQPQCGTDVQAGDIQPDVVGRPPLREPSGLRTAGRRASCRGRRRCFCHTCKRGNCRDLPSRGSYPNTGRRRYARPDQTVVPCDIQPEAEPLASRPVFLAEVYLAPISGHMAVQPCEGYVVQVPGTFAVRRK